MEKLITIENIKNIEEILAISDKLPVFALPGYLKFKSDDFGWFKTDKFILPYYISKKLIFKRIFFTTNIISLENKTGITEKKDFIENVLILTKKIGIDIIDTHGFPALFDIVPDNAVYEEFGSYIIDLDNSQDELFKKLHSKHRNVIRKAEKDNVEIKNNNEFLDDCFEVISATYARQSKGFISKTQYLRLFECLENNITCFTAFKNGILQGCAILLWSKGQSSYYLYGGSIEKPYTGSLNLLQWNAILYMKQNDVKFYDFLGARLNPDKGSKLEGIQRFKVRFGGELKQGYLWKLILNPFKYSIFEKIFKIYYLLKGKKYTGGIIENEKRRKKNNSNI